MYSIYGNDTVVNEDGEVEDDLEVDYSYNNETGEVDVELGGWCEGEPEPPIVPVPEELPEPEVEVVKTVTPVIPEEPVEPGEEPELPTPEEEEEKVENACNLPKPERNYVYSYDTSYSTATETLENPDGSEYSYTYSYPVIEDIQTDDYDEDNDIEVAIDGDSCPCELTAEAADVSDKIE